MLSAICPERGSGVPCAFCFSWMAVSVCCSAAYSGCMGRTSSSHARRLPLAATAADKVPARSGAVLRAFQFLLTAAGFERPSATSLPSVSRAVVICTSKLASARASCFSALSMSSSASTSGAEIALGVVRALQPVIGRRAHHRERVFGRGCSLLGQPCRRVAPLCVELLDIRANRAAVSAGCRLDDLLDRGRDRGGDILAAADREERDGARRQYLRFDGRSCPRLSKDRATR